MNSEQSNMTEIESMQLITSMINKAKNRFGETGTLYIMWGWLVLICSLFMFTALYFFNNENAYYVWYITWLAPIYQIFYLRRRKNKRTAKTYTGEIIGFVWAVFIVCTTLLVFILIHFKAYSGINPAVLVMYGMPTLLSGVILKFRSLRIGGICCWVFFNFGCTC